MAVLNCQFPHNVQSRTTSGIPYIVMLRSTKTTLRRATKKSARRPPRKAVRGSGPPVEAPAASAAQQRVIAPRITRSARGFRVQHREFVGNVSNTAAYSVQQYSLNPGIAATFPWLANQAVDWEQYTVHKLHAIFVTRAGTTEVGSVIIAPDYDAADAPPSSEQAITQMQDAVEDAPWKDQRCILDPKSMHPLGPRKFVRASPVAGDIKTYDVGTLFVATVGSSTNQIGKLWLDYDIEFFVPQNGEPVTSSPRTCSLFLLHHTQAYTTGTPAVVEFDETIFDAMGVGSGLVGGVFTPPKGTYKLTANFSVRMGIAGDVSVDLFFLKNGSTTLLGSGPSYVSYARETQETATLVPYIQITLVTIVECNGSDTFALQATPSGIGALTSAVDGTSLLVELC